MKFLFENQILDVSRRELRRDREMVAVEPQVFDLLLYLIRNRDRVVSRDDLIAEVWGGRVVSLGEPITLKTADHASLQNAWKEFEKKLDRPITRAAAIAVASPIIAKSWKSTWAWAMNI